jgi:hypothetical protein
MRELNCEALERLAPPPYVMTYIENRFDWMQKNGHPVPPASLLWLQRWQKIYSDVDVPELRFMTDEDVTVIEQAMGVAG